MEPKFFATAAEWREWLNEHHRQAHQLLVGFYKKDSGIPSLSWPESVDAALCFGWIDGVRRRIDEVSYSIRFTPRKLHSIWSAVNIRRVTELTSQRLMQPARLKAFEARQDERSGIYSFEQAHIELDSFQISQFQANETAWKFFQTQPPSYTRLVIWRIITAKRQETKDTRLAKLIQASARLQRMD